MLCCDELLPLQLVLQGEVGHPVDVLALVVEAVVVRGVAVPATSAEAAAMLASCD